MADRDILYDRYTYLEIEHQIYPADYLYPDDELYPASERPMHFDRIVSGTLNLSEMIADGALKFGIPYANKFEVELYDTEDLTNKDIKVFQRIDGIDTVIFTGKINSCKKDSSGTYRRIVAYDAFYELSKKNVADWWNTFWEARYDSETDTYTKATLKQIRTSLLQYVGLEEANPLQWLPNENVSVGKTVAISQMSFTDMCKHIFELSGYFPNINREGKLEYILLGAYTADIIDKYETDSSEFSDYATQKITGVRIIDSTGAVLMTSGTEDNAYNVSGNIFLMDFYDDYGESTTSQMGKLSNISRTLLDTIKNITYTPSDVNMIVSLMSCKLGDKLHTELGDIYVLENEYSGIQLVDQNISCHGDEYLEQVEGAVDLNYQILGEKYIRVKQDIDEFSVELGDLAESTSTRFSQTANQIQAEVTRAQASEGELSSRITQTADSIETEVVRVTNDWLEEAPIGTKLTIKFRGIGVPWTVDANQSGSIDSFPDAEVNDLYLDVETGYVYKIVRIYEVAVTPEESEQEDEPEATTELWADWAESYQLQGTNAYFRSSISQTNDAITAEVTRATQAEGQLSGRVDVASDEITAEVTRATQAEDQLSGRVDVAADAITAEVTRATQAEGQLSGRIDVNADAITAEVTRATASEEELSSSISITADAITSTVAGYQTVWDEGALDIPYKNYGVISSLQLDSEEPAPKVNELYLDIDTGKVYKIASVAKDEDESTDDYSYYNITFASNSTQLKTTRASVSSEIEQTATSIRQEVSNADGALSSRIEQTLSTITIEVQNNTTTAGIYLTTTTEDGSSSQKTLVGTINMTGLVKFSNLSTAGETTINGANIQTGTLSADKITTGTMSCDRLSGGEIYGQTINGGVISGSDITTNGSLKMRNALGDTNVMYVDYEGTVNPVSLVINASALSYLKVIAGAFGAQLSGNISVDGRVTASSLQSNDTTTSTQEANCRFTTGDTKGLIREVKAGSSIRYKHDFSKEFNDDLDPHKLYDLMVYQYKYQTNYLDNKDDVRYNKDLIGFIAENVYKCYPIAAEYEYDKDNDKIKITGWNTKYIVPPMLKLIQEQHEEIEAGKAEIAQLNSKVKFLENELSDIKSQMADILGKIGG